MLTQEQAQTIMRLAQDLEDLGCLRVLSQTDDTRQEYRERNEATFLALRDYLSLLTIGVVKTKVTESDLVDALELNTRIRNCMKAGDIFTIADLIGKTKTDLRDIPNLGLGSISLIEHALARHGLALKKRTL